MAYNNYKYSGSPDPFCKGTFPVDMKRKYIDSCCNMTKLPAETRIKTFLDTSESTCECDQVGFSNN